jgi:DNA-binding IclR family transcriptional regulator
MTRQTHRRPGSTSTIGAKIARELGMARSSVYRLLEE